MEVKVRRIGVARLAVAGLLVLAGILFLLQNFNLLTNAFAAIWAIIWIAAGVGFILYYLRFRAFWWLLIPGLICLAIGVLTGLDALHAGVAENIAGAVLLGGIGVAFVVIYIMHQRQWWALIPAGALISLAAVTGWFGTTGTGISGGFFLVGLGLTFVIIQFLPTYRPRSNWPGIVGAVLLVLGAASIGTGTYLGNLIWPIALIALGLFLAFFWLRPRRRV
jgi:hypothetical protein